MEQNVFDKIDGKNSIPVAYAPDDNFAVMTLVAMMSVLKNTNSNIDFLILYSKLSEKSFEILNFPSQFPNCRVNFVKIDEKIFSEFQNASWVTIQAWFRILIPKILKNCSKAIYLDCDTLANKDIAELYNTDISDVWLGAVTDVWNVKTFCDRLKMRSPSYFNSGVMLINCDKWRENDLFEKLKDCALNNSDIKYGDQDVLNFVIDENKRVLSTKFNYIETWWYNYYNEYTGDAAIDYEQSKTSPVIIHFTGTKPFSPRSRHSWRGEWWKYAKQTPCYQLLLENYRISNESYIQELEGKYTELDNLLKRTKEVEQCIDNIEQKLNRIDNNIN